MARQWLFGGTSSPRRAPIDRHQHRHRPSLPSCVVAPRNSLEQLGQEQNEQIQMGLEINTNFDHNALDSPSVKTPNLLARLMGLDILPQTTTSPSATRSLPNSPRVSSSRLSDVDRHHHRHSLDINLDIENSQICKEMKQEEEQVRRKVALVDITNNNNKLVYGKLKNQDVTMFRKHNSISTLTPTPTPTPKRKPRQRLEKKKKKSLLLRRPKSRCRFPNGKQRPAAEEVGRRSTADGGAGELKYIKRILTSPNWFSPTNPLNPSIFHHLETSSAAVGEPRLERWNKDDDDEVLGEMVMNCRTRMMMMKGWELARAKCHVLEDIDSLIDKDLGKWKKVLELEGVVRTFQFHILDSLLRETTATIMSLHKRCRFVPHGFVLT
ncbi:hypothetical protein SDJN03_03003, partial [Cucurbita argyrosperma subsp. sororia]